MNLNLLKNIFQYLMNHFLKEVYTIHFIHSIYLFEENLLLIYCLYISEEQKLYKGYLIESMDFSLGNIFHGGVCELKRTSTDY